ncbi:MAG: alpha-xylosidase [Paenibacillaceae bacterium]|jgi:alpha-D-xyloside xylohydrolase|nr:alpha-xylosidase [Paenibacillaceae bacterium]
MIPLKFTDGNWMIKDGFTVQGAVQAHDFERSGNRLTAYASPRPIAGRGGMLDTMLLTVQFHSPLPGVIGVKLIHHAGGLERGPAFELACGEGSFVRIEDNEEEAALYSGELSVHIRKGPEWQVEFRRGSKRLTGSGPKSMAYIREDSHKAYMREELDLDVGELVYGLGERFTPFVKNGQTVDIWNKDGGTSSEQTYKNIPFYISNKGYGVLVNQPELVSFEVGSEKVKKVQFSIEGESMEYFLIDGPAMKDVLRKYAELTGKPALPPAWTFGLWLSTSFTTDYDEQTVTSIVDGMLARDIPLSVFHFDCFWMRDFHWTDFKWDERVFPDPAGMLARLKAKGLKICVWINPYIAQRSRLFEEGKINGYLVKKANGDVWQTDQWQPGMALVDFTNPSACRWFAKYLRELADTGVDCFKTDFGERIPTNVVYFDGSDPFKMHNYYTYLYNKTVFETLEDRFGQGNAAVFARSATVGGQKFPVHWGGDCYADYGSMAESLRGGLSLGLSGFGFWSHDIGGFENTAPHHVFKRWLAFGLLSSHSRLHGSKSYRVPWAYDEESVEVARRFTKLKCELMPYLYNAAVEAHEDGVPVMRAMVLEFPEDPTAGYLDRQYMLGGSLLAAPVFEERGLVTYYLPEGRWTHLLTGETVEGGRWMKEIYDFLSLPLFVRPSSILAIGACETAPDYDYADGVELRLYELQEGTAASATVRNIGGAVALQVEAVQENGTICVAFEGAGKAFSIRMYGAAAAAADGASASLEGDVVKVPAGNRSGVISITLRKY